MTAVYVKGLTDKLYWNKMEKSMAVLSTFASSGNGWVVKKIKIDIKLARYRPFPGSSYLVLPNNSQTVADYSFETTGMPNVSSIISLQLIHEISLDRDDRNYHIHKTFPATYQQKTTLTNLCAILICQRNLGKWKPLKPSMMWQLTSLVEIKDNFTFYESPLFYQLF